MTRSRFKQCGWVAGLILVALGTAACNRSAVGPGTTLAAQQPAGQPQPRLPTIKLWVGPHELVAEQAVTEQQRSTGMMFRQEMGENEFMLFVFPYPAQLGFWMKNTYVPLSLAYIDPDGTILEIHDLEPLNEVPVESASHHVQYVLETKQGWFERNNVRTGMVMRTESGTLRETYFGGR